MTLIDSHCHFDFPDFDDDREEIWQQCQNSGITHLIIPGTRPDTWQQMAAKCHKKPTWFFSVGLHPYFLSSAFPMDIALQTMASHLEDPKCIGIGECGLDKRLDTPMELQRDVFEQQLNLATRHQVPTIIHSVKAHNETLHHLKHHPNLRGVIHAFSGSYETAKQFVDKGFYIGVGGVITYPNATKTREAIEKLPIDCMVLETDSPDMPLYGQHQKRNNPIHLIDIANQLAELKNLPFHTVASQTTKNTTQLFYKLVE